MSILQDIIGIPKDASLFLFKVALYQSKDWLLEKVFKSISN
jgi:hypothetical protein